MNGHPEHEPGSEPSSSIDSGADESVEAAGVRKSPPEALQDWTPEASPLTPVAPSFEVPQEPERPMFQQWYVPPPRPPVRIPHLGHVGILLIFTFSGLFAAGILMAVMLRFHMLGITSLENAKTDVHLMLGSEAIVYVLMLGACLLFFPMIWHKGFFEGIHWNSDTALRLRKQLFITAFICFVLALVNGLLLPSPKNAPIDKIFRTPGAAWLLFIFGITFAPFFEELIFRGFVLPAMCTACDWIHEKTSHVPVRPLDENGHPQWSLAAMVIGSLATSVPFAGMHAAQTGYSFGPFILLVGVSLVLCWARLRTRSLAASVLVHAFYNFFLFSLMILGTSGFRHMDKL
jgi:membrane protease YdiL (CAAX protease family)